MKGLYYYIWLSGLGVWFALRVREVPGSNPGWAHSKNIFIYFEGEIRIRLFLQVIFSLRTLQILIANFINSEKKWFQLLRACKWIYIEAA